MAQPLGAAPQPLGTSTTDSSSILKQISDNTLNQLIGSITETTSSQSSSMTASLAALAAAINAKPSA